MAPPPLVRRFEACADAVAGVRREAVGYAREHGALDPDGVALALSEALTNAVLHAYPDARRPGTVEVVAQRHPDDGLQVEVCDDGRGMTPRADSPGAGLGLSIIAQLAERFEVQARPGGGTRLRMVFAAA
jgi:anti-sigma regulatory factor (Ser/Thr protein kinase)